VGIILLFPEDSLAFPSPPCCSTVGFLAPSRGKRFSFFFLALNPDHFSSQQRETVFSRVTSDFSIPPAVRSIFAVEGAFLALKKSIIFLVCRKKPSLLQPTFKHTHKHRTFRSRNLIPWHPFFFCVRLPPCNCERTLSTTQVLFRQRPCRFEDECGGVGELSFSRLAV